MESHHQSAERTADTLESYAAMPSFKSENGKVKLTNVAAEEGSAVQGSGTEAAVVGKDSPEPRESQHADSIKPKS